MKVVIFNKSRKKRLIKTNRILSCLLFKISNRVYIGDIPSRIIVDLIKELKQFSGRGTAIKIFIESKSGFYGFYLVEIGKKEILYENFVYSDTNIKEQLRELIPNSETNKK